MTNDRWGDNNIMCHHGGFYTCADGFNPGRLVFCENRYYRTASFQHGFSWWRHQMETFSVSLAICVGNSPSNRTAKDCANTSVRYSNHAYSAFCTASTPSQYNIKTVFPGMRIPMLKIRRSRERFIFNMGIHIPVGLHFILRLPPVLYEQQEHA